MLTLLLLFSLVGVGCHHPTVPPTADAHYSPADSVQVERLLANTTLLSPLDFARCLKGRPYVPFTLETGDPERLVVNLRELDCATLVETSLALAWTRRRRETAFADYCRSLRRLRYFDGRTNGYLSRLHYLSFWMKEQTGRGTVAEVVLPAALTQPLNVRLNYMSTHPQAYAALRAHPEWVDSIAALERRYSGRVGRFIPKHHLGKSRRELEAIHDGDVIAIVTSKAGLDYSHQGLALWGADGRLHMLHASSDRKRVIEDERTLQDYLNRIPHTLGIRVFRLTAR